MKRIASLFALAFLALAGPVSASVSMSSIGGWADITAVNTYTTTAVTGSVSVGGSVVVAAYIPNPTGVGGFVIQDSSGNCSNDYSIQNTANTTAAGQSVIGYCANIGTALTSGTSTITITWTGSTAKVAIAAFSATGLNTTTPFNVKGSAAQATWTSGSPLTTVPTTPTLTCNNEYAFVVTGVSIGAAADTLGTYTGGFAALLSVPAGGTNNPEEFIAYQTVTSGTATLGATPTSAAGRNYLSNAYMFNSSGATCGLGGTPQMTLLGVGP